jgi:hypothetical protein
MVTPGRTDGAARRAALGGIAASLVMIGLTACGSAVAGANGAAKPAPGATGGAAANRAASKVNPGGPMAPAGASKHVLLCTEIPNLTRLTFTRTAWPPPFPHPHYAVPTGFIVRDVATVRRVATVLCGLPVVPRGVMSCPDLVGGSFHLFFTAPGKTIPVVGIQYSGCRVVTGLGPARTWVAAKALQQLLLQGLGDPFKLIPPSR